MKTTIYFLLTCCISTGAFFAAANMKNPFPAFIVAFAAWALFFWGWQRRLKKDARRHNRERLFNEYMRSQSRRRY